MEKLEERRRQEDQVFNKLLAWFAGAVVYEMVALFLKRFFINYNQMSAGAVKFSMLIGSVLDVLQYAALALTVVALAWCISSHKKQKSVVVPGMLALFGGALTVTAFVAYRYRGLGVSILGAVAPVVAVLAIIFFLYQREFFYNAIFAGMGVAALWVYRKAYLGLPGTVRAGFVCVWVLLAAAAILAWKISKNNGRLGKHQILTEDANCLLTYATVGLSALALVFAMAFGATVAYYAIMALVAWLFFMAVYYTVRMM